MTGPLEFLQAAHARAEQVAQALMPGSWRWLDIEDDDGEHTELVGADDQAVLRSGDASCYRSWIWRCEGFDAYLPLIDPAAVLRRIAKERELLDLHACDTFGGLRKCRECGQGYELADWGPDHPCATVRLLAEAWGWQEEEQRG